MPFRCVIGRKLRKNVRGSTALYEQPFSGRARACVLSVGSLVAKIRGSHVSSNTSAIRSRDCNLLSSARTRLTHITAFMQTDLSDLQVGPIDY